jgi:hypothetical protein
MQNIRLAHANIVSAFDHVTVGSKVIDHDGFLLAACEAIRAFDFVSQKVPGQGFIMCPAAVPFVLAGAGKRTKDPNDFVLRVYRGEVQPFLRREKAAPVEGCALVIYTKEAYLAAPDVAREPEEVARIQAEDPTHVVVAVLAFAGPKPPLTPYRLVHNLAGGNKEALVWTADEIREKAVESLAYDREWATVAD